MGPLPEVPLVPTPQTAVEPEVCQDSTALGTVSRPQAEARILSDKDSGALSLGHCQIHPDPTLPAWLHILSQWQQSRNLRGKARLLPALLFPLDCQDPSAKPWPAKPCPAAQTMGQAPEQEKTCPDQKLLPQPGLLQHVGLCLQGQAHCCERMGSREEVPASSHRTTAWGEDKGRAGTEHLWLTGMEFMTGLGSHLKHKAPHCGDETTEPVSLGPGSQAWDQAPQHDGKHCQAQDDGTSAPSPLQGVSSEIQSGGTCHSPSPLCRTVPCPDKFFPLRSALSHFHTDSSCPRPCHGPSSVDTLTGCSHNPHSSLLWHQSQRTQRALCTQCPHRAPLGGRTRSHWLLQQSPSYCHCSQQLLTARS